MAAALSSCTLPLTSTVSSSLVEQASIVPVSSWTRQQEKVFENALAVHDQDTPDRWENIAALVPGMNAASVKDHYDLLVEDVDGIDAGRIPLPLYFFPSLSAVDGAGEPSVASGEGSSLRKGGNLNVGQSPAAAATSNGNCGTGKGASSKSSDQERRKGIPWTEEEHRLFLLGLDRYGKGDWRSISRNFVISRTPTQVASHAQKYFIRLNSMNKDRRRSSIHDITSVGNEDVVHTCQGPITGQAAAGPPLSHSPTSGITGGSVYGAPVGQPIAGPVGSTVGTPVLLPPLGVGGPYVARGALVRPVMPGAPIGVLPVAYSLSQPALQPAVQPASQPAAHQ
eukprot:c25902_g1_i1 orf=344-1360(+)